MARYSRTNKPLTYEEPQGRVKIYDRIYAAFVKDTQDVQKMGRLKVWIPEFGSQPGDRDSWVTVSYASPFAGATDPTKVLGTPDRSDPRTKRDVNTQTSYGWWGVPPDLENIVLVFFINGEPSRGVWFACMYQQYMNQMVPGVAAKDENYGDNGKALPVTEYNKATSERFRDAIQRPESTIQSKAIKEQGLINDNIRGVTDTSARREAPSQTYGILTPGPKREGSDSMRTGGSSFYLDDHPDHEHVRIRTKSGAQILIDETNGLMYAINTTGTSWMQMDSDGNVDIFGAKSFSVRAQEDINLRADRDVNVEAGRNLNLKASKDHKGGTDGSVGSEGSGSGGDVNIEGLNTISTKAPGTISFDTDANYLLKSANLNITSSSLGFGGVGRYAGNLHGANMITPQITLNSLNNHVHGGVQSGGSSTAPYLGTGSAVGTVIGPPVSKIDTQSKTNVLNTFRTEKKYDRNTEGVLTLVGRFLTFEPCPEHKNNGQS